MSASEKKLQSQKTTSPAGAMPATSSSTSRGCTPAAQQAEEDATCKYSQRSCSRNCLAGYDFCIRHILEDKTAPYKQCAYMTKAGRKCPAAAPKLEKKEGFCSAHNRKTLLARQRLARKRRPGETGETLLEELVALTSATSGSGALGGLSYNEHRRSKMLTDSVASRALEYASSSDSESEMGPTVEHTWRDDGDSDAESIDSDQEDLLNVKLYKKDPLQKDRYRKLRAMQQYHKKAGKEALLQRQSTERRVQASTDVSSRGQQSSGPGLTAMQAAKPAIISCSFLDEDIVCGARAVPLSKFCQKHILHDPCQLLYRPCPFADSQCGRPVPTLLNTQYCSLHQALPSEGIKLEDDKSGGDQTLGSLQSDKDHSVGTKAHPLPNSVGTGEKKMEVKQEVKPDIDRLTVIDDNGGRTKASRPQQVQTTIGLAGSATTTSSSTLGTCSHSGHSVVGVGSRDIKMEEEEEEVNDAGNTCTTAASSADDMKGEKCTQEEDEEESMVIFTLGEEDEDEEEDKQGR
ncbi:KAT8 regulatory NSL complex subunit 2-like [Elysia marginata]|uniref:KAT8 regulatory NSL complex subunit 2 n=1 Tax=Elysia marginata TaxID=1093978 RepID=A0AAV4G0V4_9GAST|nr:KAT8 regulatory NSL complex subunit 2-like [Elysia marginata]